MHTKTFLAFGSLALAAACSAASSSTTSIDAINPADGGIGAAPDQGAGGDQGAPVDFGAGGGAFAAAGASSTGSNGSAGGSTMGTCDPTNMAPDGDKDHDGFTIAQGDCDDCNPNINPGAYDAVDYVLDAMGNPTSTPLEASKQIDQDCDGKPTPVGAMLACDQGLDVVVGDPFNAAKAMELCNVRVEESPADAKKRTWGVLDAKFSNIAGAFLQVPPPSFVDVKTVTGIVPNFGAATKPQGGVNVFALSSGQARAPGQPDFVSSWKCDEKNSLGHDNPMSWPAGFPKTGTCSGGLFDSIAQPFDGIALDLRVRVPTNATGFTFQYRFFTCEYPVYTCQSYNDTFAVLMDPNPLPSTDVMFPDVAYESTAAGKNVIGVNNESFLTACAPGAAQKGNYPNCKGPAELTGSGFENNGASAWLVSQVPVTPGSIINLRLAIWDSADWKLDSTAVVDNFQWIVDTKNPIEVGTTVVTNPH